MPPVSMVLIVSFDSMADNNHTDELVDWEHFLALLAAIRSHLPDERYLLTAALPAGRWALQNIDLYKAQDYL